jgi:N-acetylneuraminic acid mutarotase
LWEFDPVTNIWTKKSNYPGSGSTLNIAFSINGKGYVGIGGSPSARHIDFYEYNPTTDAWTQKANFPGGARYSAGTFVIGNAAYIVCGSCGTYSCFKNDLWMYVPSTNTWTQKANFPGGNITGPTVFTIGQFGYVGGGVTSSASLTNNYYKYSPATNSWSSIASMPGTARRSAFAFVLDNKAYATTGAFGNASPTLQNDGYVYNPSSNSWSHFECNSDFIKRYVSSGVTLNDSTILAGLGVDQNGFFLSDMWQLKLNSDTCSFYDTTYVTVYDTIAIPVNDTTFVIIRDTLTVYDTVVVQKFDTTLVQIYDTTIVPIYDTISIIRFDTLYRTFYDTISVYSYDTITVVKYISVEDTLDVWLYGYGGCGDILLQLYPNPSRDIVYLYTNKWSCLQGSKVQLVDQLGQVLETQPYSQSTVSFDISGYARALYYVRIVNASGATIFYKKLVIQ